MANEEDVPLAGLYRIAEVFLNRPISAAEKQVLEAFVQDKPMDFARASQRSIERAREFTARQILSDELRTHEVVQQFSTSENPLQRTPAQREQLIRQLLLAAESLKQPPAASATIDDPAFRKMLAEVVREEVHRYSEEHMTGLIEQVESLLEQLGETTRKPH